MEEEIKSTLSAQSHKDYIAHQKIKTTNLEKIKKWQNEEWDLKLNGFKGIFT